MSTRVFVAITEAEFTRLYDAEAQDRLRALGDIVHGEERDGRIPVPHDIATRFDVLITSWTTAPFDAEILDGPRLRLAVHSAGSVRNLFPVRALGRAVRLAQGGADAMALAVAEMTLALTLAHLRNVVWHDRRFQQSRDWKVGGFGVLGQSIAAQRIGIVSLSRVGRHFVKMVQALGARQVRAYDPYTSAESAAELGVELCSLEELCSTSDVLSIHAPSTPETESMLGAHHFRRLPDGAIVINTARAQVTDEAALLREVRSGRLRVALDVFTNEPLNPDNEFFGHENAILMPHVAGGTVQARFAQGAHVVDEIEAFLRDGTLRSEVTTDNYDRLG